MAIHKTPEVLGQQPVPASYEGGDVHEVLIKYDATLDTLAAGDFIQLIRIPAFNVISNVRVASSATTGTSTVEVGIADAELTTAIATTFNTAAAITTTAVSGSTVAVLQDVASPLNDRILVAKIAVGTITTQTLYFAISFRPARYGV